jgi:hypothetical protein
MVHDGTENNNKNHFIVTTKLNGNLMKIQRVSTKNRTAWADVGQKLVSKLGAF